MIYWLVTGYVYLIGAHLFISAVVWPRKDGLLLKRRQINLTKLVISTALWPLAYTIALIVRIYKNS